jgi:predicted GNAT superfamily acetyltransferase
MRKMERVASTNRGRFLLRVETSHEASDYQKYEDIRNAIWGFPEDHLSGIRNMMCENILAEGGSLFIGAVPESADGGFPDAPDRLAGFCYGFVGVRDKVVGFRDPANLRFYSQFAGVRPEYRASNLGILIKEFQREIVRDFLGIGTVICTFDPLTGVNAHRNIHHFRMEVEEYRVATYGEYGGLLNRRDVPTDRLLMSWDLARPVREDADSAGPLPSGSVAVFQVETVSVKGKAGERALEVVRAVDLGPGRGPVLLQIPVDFYGMLDATDVADPEVRRIPLDWRLHTRRAFEALFARGLRISDFLKAGPGRSGSFYILD